jgi:hypothetical protein
MGPITVAGVASVVSDGTVTVAWAWLRRHIWLRSAGEQVRHQRLRWSIGSQVAAVGGCGMVVGIGRQEVVARMPSSKLGPPHMGLRRESLWGICRCPV